MNILDQLNSTPLYLISGLVILFVAAMSIFFMIRAYRDGTRFMFVFLRWLIWKFGSACLTIRVFLD